MLVAVIYYKSYSQLLNMAEQLLSKWLRVEKGYRAQERNAL